MRTENVFSKFTKNHAKINCQYFFFHWDSRYRPYEEDFTPSFNIFGHYMPFLSTNLFRKTPMFLQSCLTFNGGVKSAGPILTNLAVVACVCLLIE